MKYLNYDFIEASDECSKYYENYKKQVYKKRHPIIYKIRCIKDNIMKLIKSF